MKGNKYTIALLAVIGSIFFLMNTWTPLYSDDWHYCFIFGTTTPIESISDILKSQYHHYFAFNGRLVPHLFVQLFDGITGKACFDIVNTGMFLLFLYLTVTLASHDKKQYYKLLTLSVAFTLWLIPGFKNCFLWMSGACNYLWAGVFLMSFHLLLRRDFSNKAIYPLLFCVGISCGWTHEGMVIGLAAGYMAYYATHRKELTSSRMVQLAGFAIGVLFIIFSPANIHRALDNAEGGAISDIIRVYASALTGMNNLRLFFIALIILAGSYFHRKEWTKRFICDNLVWVIAGCVSFAFLVFTKHASAHSRFGIELFSLILLLKVFAHIHIPQKFLSIWNIAMCTFLAVILQANFNNYKESAELTTQIRDTDNEIISTHYPAKTSFPTRFVIKMIDDTEQSSSFDKDNWTNQIIATYFKRSPIIVLPALFLEELKQSPASYEQFHTQEGFPFYAKHIQKGVNVTDATFILRKPHKEEIPFYHRPFADKMSRYSAMEIKTDRFVIVEIEGESYLLVGKKSIINDRVTDIQYR